MRALYATVFFLVSAAAPVDAQSPVLPDVKNISLGIGEQVPTGFIGVGARAMGMGGAQISSVYDGTALYWNPAALTRMRKIELFGGLGHFSPSSTAEVGAMEPEENSAEASFTRLNSAVLTIPYPTYRGGLTFAFGVNRPADYGYRGRLDGEVQIAPRTTSFTTRYEQWDYVRQEGGLRSYSMGMGIEVSPQVALGMAVSWHSGSVDVRREITLVEAAEQTLPDSLVGMYAQENDIKGFAFTFGTTVALPYGLQWGAVAIPPVTYSHEGIWGDAYSEAIGDQIRDYDYQENYLKYKIRTPWQLGIGLSWTTYAFTLSSDLWWIDWTQARYDGEPYDASVGVDPATFFEDRYDPQFRFHIGGEALVPFLETYLRLGYYHNSDPFSGPKLDSSADLRYRDRGNYYTVGFGRLFDQVLTMDVALVYGGSEYVAGTIAEKRTSTRLLVSAAYRL